MTELKERSDVNDLVQARVLVPFSRVRDDLKFRDFIRRRYRLRRKGVSPHPENGYQSAHQNSKLDADEPVAVLKGVKCEKRRKVLAIASKGGHWIELLRLRPALAESDVTFVTTDPTYKSMVQGEKFIIVCEATRNHKLCLLLLLAQIFWLLLTLRPHAIISTGAAPGYFAVRLGKLFGAKTLWIDSMANAEELSLSGKLASRHADVTLTQWRHLASQGTAEFQGAVI